MMAGQVFYKRKSDGAIVPINPGPKGDKGDTGPQGDKGDPGPPGGAVLSGWWTYSTTTTGPAPEGQVRTDPALSAIDSSGTFWLNPVDADGLDWTGVTVQVGSQFYLRDDQGNQWVLDVDAVNGTGDFTVTLVSSTGTAPKKNARVQVSLVQTTYTQAQLDARYVNADGDTMSGSLDIAPSGPVNVRARPGGTNWGQFGVYPQAGGEAKIMAKDGDDNAYLSTTKSQWYATAPVRAPAPTAAQHVPRLTRTPNAATGDLGLPMPGYAGSDTGWRDVSGDLLDSGWQLQSSLPTFWLRRYGTRVQCVMRIERAGTTAVSGVVIVQTLPTGFRKATVGAGSFAVPASGVLNVDGGYHWFGTLRSASSLIAYKSHPEVPDLGISARVWGLAEWESSDPWPTSLPGTQITAPATWT